MSDFMRWLYANYIWPELEKVDRTGYQMELSVVENSIEPEMRQDYRRALEFYAGNAFLLGFRTGVGLGRECK